MKHLISLFLLSVCFYQTNAQSLRQSAWQQHVNYTINATLDDVDHLVRGDVSIEYINNSPQALSFIYFHLWPNAYSSNSTAFAKQMAGNGDLSFHYSKAEDRGWIREVNFTANGKALVSETKAETPDIVKVLLSEALQPGQSVTISTAFLLKIPKVFSRLGHDGQDYYMTQWYPKPAVYDVNGWHPMPYLNQGEFYSEFGNFEVNITVPANYVLAATGEVQGNGEPSFWKQREAEPLNLPKDSVPPSSVEDKTVTFKASNVHDFAWFASKKFNVVSDEVEIGGRSVKTRVFDYNPNRAHLTHIRTALTVYSEEVGPYPYPQASVVGGQLKAGGGMEYPMITICDQLGESVIVHEVGHNWFYGILANDERIYPWMDESINSFYENKALNDTNYLFTVKGLDAKFMRVPVKNNLIKHKHQAVAGPSAEFTKLNYGVSVYVEGAKAFGHLHYYLGDERFKQAMQSYYDKWKFRHPLPGDMQAVFEEVTQKDLSWFFEGVLQATDEVDYSVRRSGNVFTLVNRGDIAAPVPVHFTGRDLDQVIWYQLEPGASIKVETPGADKAVIDPKGQTMDSKSSNDATNKRTRLKFGSGFGSKTDRLAYVLPGLAWNHYDGFMLGLTLHNKELIPKKLEWYVAPHYGLRSKKITGLASVRYTHAMPGTGAYLKSSLTAQKFSWSQTGFSEYSYLKLNPQLEYNLPQSSLRSKVSTQVSLAYDYIHFSPNFNLEEAREASKNPNYSSLGPWQFISAKYSYKNERSLNPYGLSFEIEQGMNSTKVQQGQWDTTATDTSFNLVGTRMTRSNHTKLTAILDLDLDVGLPKKAITIRGFASYFINSPEDGFFNHQIGYTGFNGMRSDTRFNELAMYRNASEGMLRNQLNTTGSGSRFVGIVDQSDKLMANVIITGFIPGKLPIKPYIELLTFTDMDKKVWNSSKASLIYAVGLEIGLIPDAVSIYINLAQSKDVTERQSNNYIGVKKFHERITFKLDLNKIINLDPEKFYDR